MRRVPRGHPVVLTEDEARWAIHDAQVRAYRRRTRASLRAARQVARCRHLYDSATGRCRFCGAAHPGKVAP